MAKKIQLHIPEPCHENWENMTPVEKGRFCDSCQKQVVDFSNMTDREIAQFFKKPSTGSVCGRFMQDQLNRKIDIPKKRIPWIKYFFQFTMPLFIGSLKANAQKTLGKVAVMQTEICTETTMGDTVIMEPIRIVDENIVDGNTIEGKVITTDGIPVPYATISIKESRRSATADAEGHFIIVPKKNWKRVTLTASADGFTTAELDVKKDVYSKIVMEVVPGETMIGGLVFVTMGLVVTEPELNPNVFPNNDIMDPPFGTFKVFPNPVKSGSPVNIGCKEVEAGYYELQLVDQSGKTVKRKEIWIDEEARVLNVELPSIATGGYFMYIRNKRTGKYHTEKIIVQ